MTAAPRVSVVMTVRDGERFLREAVESILTQTLLDIELIAVDDGSTDATPAILAAFAARDARIRVITQVPAGIAAAANRGLAAARAELVARIDSDDVAFPDRLERQATWLAAHPEVAVVGGWIVIVDETGRKTRIGTYPESARDIRALLLQDSVLAHPAVMFRKGVVTRVGGYRPAFTYASDYDLWLRIDERADLANMPEPLLYYREHGGQITDRFRDIQIGFRDLALGLARRRRSGLSDLLSDGLTVEAACAALASAAASIPPRGKQPSY